MRVGLVGLKLQAAVVSLFVWIALLNNVVKLLHLEEVKSVRHIRLNDSCERELNILR
jgi:hypothetical protein